MFVFFFLHAGWAINNNLGIEHQTLLIPKSSLLITSHIFLTMPSYLKMFEILLLKSFHHLDIEAKLMSSISVQNIFNFQLDFIVDLNEVHCFIKSRLVILLSRIQ